MDRLTFLASVIKSLAWPVIAIVTILVLKEQIGRVIGDSGCRERAMLRHTTWWLSRPQLDQHVIRELQLYSTDGLREKYHSAPGGDPATVTIELRDGVIISRKHLRAEILWRLGRERRMNVVIVIGAVAAVIAAIEGLH